MGRISTIFMTAVAALLLGPVAAPTGAYAAGGGGFLCDIFACFSVAPLACSLGSVRVDGTPSRHKYSFGYECGSGISAQVDAAYDPGSGRASEKIRAASGKWTFRAQWTCASDPWVASDRVACGDGKISTKGNAGGFSPKDISYPVSAGSLSGQSRHVLAAQLNNALNAGQQSDSDPAPAAPVQSPQDTGGADHSDVLRSVFSADLTVIRIDGATALRAGEASAYSFIVGNIGNGAGSVEVNILFVGALDQIGGVSADSGLGCDVSKGGGNVNATVHCSGGRLDPQRSATITVTAIGTTAGPGSMIASLNNSRALVEADYDNNLGRRDVTVN